MGLLYIGCYTSETGGQGVGVTTCSRDGTRLATLAELATPSPSYLVADQTTLFAVNELSQGTVSSYGREPGGAVRPLSTRPTGGADPCHLALHAGHLLATNYTSGDVSVHPVNDDGTLGERTDLVRRDGRGPHPDRQEGPHAHQVLVDRHFDEDVVVVDLGTDRLLRRRLEKGRLVGDAEMVLPAGCGPRHAVRHPSGRWYVAGELGSVVLALPHGPDTAPHTVTSQPTTSADVPDGNFPSAIVLSPDARHLYVANRGADSVATFRVADDGGLLQVGEVSCGGHWPRDIAVAGDTLFVANERSHSVVGFRIDAHTGLPAPTGDIVEVGSPACVLPA